MAGGPKTAAPRRSRAVGPWTLELSEQEGLGAHTGRGTQAGAARLAPMQVGVCTQAGTRTDLGHARGLTQTSALGPGARGVTGGRAEGRPGQSDLESCQGAELAPPPAGGCAAPQGGRGLRWRGAIHLSERHVGPCLAALRIPAERSRKPGPHRPLTSMPLGAPPMSHGQVSPRAMQAGPRDVPGDAEGRP